MYFLHAKPPVAVDVVDLIEEAMTKGPYLYRKELAADCGVPLHWLPQFGKKRVIPLNAWLTCWRAAGRGPVLQGVLSWIASIHSLNVYLCDEDAHWLSGPENHLPGVTAQWLAMPKDRSTDGRTAAVRHAKRREEKLRQLQAPASNSELAEEASRAIGHDDSQAADGIADLDETK